MARAAKLGWLVIHGWAALPLWIFLFFICATGTLATVDDEILWLIDPAVRVAPPPYMPRLSLNRLVLNVERQIPGARVRTIAFGARERAAAVEVALPDGDAAVAWVNPFGGADGGRIQALSHGRSFPDTLAALHGWLLMSWTRGTPFGWYAVTALSLPLIALLVSGLMIHKRFWRSFRRPMLRRGQGARVFWGDMHRLAGALGAPFVAIIAVSSLWFLIEGILIDSNVPLWQSAPPIAPDAIPDRVPGIPFFGADLDAGWQHIVARRPDARPWRITLPEDPFTAVGFYTRLAAPTFAGQFWTDPYSGTLVDGVGPVSARVAPAITAVLGALHFGDFGGLALKILWLVFGTMLSLLVLSGAMVWMRRTVRAGRDLMTIRAVADPGAASFRARRVRLVRRHRFHLSGLLLLVPLAVVVAVGTGQALAPAVSRTLAERSVGPWRVTLSVTAPSAAVPETTLAIRFAEGYPRLIRAAFIRIGRITVPRGRGTLLRGPGDALLARLTLPEPPDPGDRIWLTVEDWSGMHHRINWPVATVIGPGLSSPSQTAGPAGPDAARTTDRE
ncbi:MAG: PepSY-associated TM helix domain-containing protein [Azospirillaceae bacterium]|nr:PepSY-associated TM helix domain-containing protein [Azospirillaceae bacterium]